jgi:hypothetical protein
MKYNFTASYPEILSLEVEADSLEAATQKVRAMIEDGTFGDEAECTDQGPLTLHEDETQQFNEQTKEWKDVTGCSVTKPDDEPKASDDLYWAARCALADLEGTDYYVRA